MMMRLFLAMLLLAATELSAAAEAVDEPAAVELRVKPLLCILDGRTPQCDMSFLVSWESDRSGYYCLFNDFVTGPLRCWSEERVGKLRDARVVSDAFRYWMTDGQNSTAVPLAAVKVEVLRLNDDDRRRKRRQRHVWDIL